MIYGLNSAGDRSSAMEKKEYEKLSGEDRLTGENCLKLLSNYRTAGKWAELDVERKTRIRQGLFISKMGNSRRIPRFFRLSSLLSLARFSLNAPLGLEKNRGREKHFIEFRSKTGRVFSI